jgi:hypothetical protein
VTTVVALVSSAAWSGNTDPPIDAKVGGCAPDTWSRPVGPSTKPLLRWDWARARSANSALTPERLVHGRCAIAGNQAGRNAGARRRGASLSACWRPAPKPPIPPAPSRLPPTWLSPLPASLALAIARPMLGAFCAGWASRCKSRSCWQASSTKEQVPPGKPTTGPFSKKGCCRLSNGHLGGRIRLFAAAWACADLCAARADAGAVGAAHAAPFVSSLR